GDDRPEAVDGADREVDPARDDHERPGRGDDERRRLLLEDVEQVRLGEERRARHREDDEQDRERDQDPEAPQPRQLGAGAQRRPQLPEPALLDVRAAAHEARWSANAAARIGPSAISPPVSTAAIRPRRMTSTRCARPTISSSSEEINSTPRPSAASEARKS